MASDDGSIRFQDTSSNPTSWLPVYGRWCGPDWSAGERGTTKSVAELGNEPVFRRIGPAGGLEVDSPLDWLCKQHDLAYLKAERKPGLEAMQKLTADIDLLGKVVSLDETLLTKDEKIYSKLMALAFAEKIFHVDVPALGYEAVVTAMKDLIYSLDDLFEKIGGLSYVDQFGAMMSGAVNAGEILGVAYDGAIEDIPFRRFTLTATGSAGASAIISYYEDEYQAAHGIASIVNGKVIEDSARTITIADDGSVFMQSGTQEPVELNGPSTVFSPWMYFDDLPLFPDVPAMPSPAGTSMPPSDDVDLVTAPMPSINGIGPSISYPLPALPWPPTMDPSVGESPPNDADGGPYYAELVDPPFPDDGTGPKGPPSSPITVYGDPLDNPSTLDALWSLYGCDQDYDFVCAILNDHSTPLPRSMEMRGVVQAFEVQRTPDHLAVIDSFGAWKTLDDWKQESADPEGHVAGQFVDDLMEMGVPPGAKPDDAFIHDSYWTAVEIW